LGGQVAAAEAERLSAMLSHARATGLVSEAHVIHGTHRLSKTMYSALLVCYPAAFRNEYGPEMLELFNYRASRGKRGAVVDGTSGGHRLYRTKGAFRRVYYKIFATHFEPFARTPVFALTGVADAGAGTGVNTAIFSVVNAVACARFLFRSLNVWCGSGR